VAGVPGMFPSDAHIGGIDFFRSRLPRRFVGFQRNWGTGV